MLVSAESRSRPVYIREWERDLQLTFTETQLDHLYSLTHKSSMDTKMHENGFKLLTLWYRVPATLDRKPGYPLERLWASGGGLICMFGGNAQGSSHFGKILEHR